MHFLLDKRHTVPYNNIYKHKNVIQKGEGNMFCNVCGKYIHEGAPFCPYCGAVVIKKKETKKEKKQRLRAEEETMSMPMAPVYPMPAPVENDSDAKKGKKTGIALLTLSFTAVALTLMFIILAFGFMYLEVDVRTYSSSSFAYAYANVYFSSSMLESALISSIVAIIFGGVGFMTSYGCRKKCSWLFVANMLNLIFAIVLLTTIGILYF